jgi:nitrate reductase NapAB chaperone NapD
VAGAIVKTNSPYVQGSKVTLLEMDFAELITNDAVLGKLANPESIEDAKQMLKGVKGVKVNLDREVMVEFK